MRKRLIPLLTCLILIFSAANCFAVSFDPDFTVDNWDSQITVRENADYHVVETIDAHFLVSYKHGILRTIPIAGTLRRDGQSSKYKAKVENIKVTDGSGNPIPFSTSKTRSDGEKLVQIKIGDADSYAEEYSKYIIEYDYDMLGDRLKDGDEIYLNIIGEQWPTDIAHMTFNVTFTKPIKPGDAGVMIGNTRIKNANEPVEEEDYSSQYEEITGESYDDYLQNTEVTLPENGTFTATETNLNANLFNISYGTGVSFRVLVADDYFKEAGFFDSHGFFGFIVGGLASLLLLYSLFITLMSKKEEKDLVAPITVMPPQINSKKLPAYVMAYIYNRGQTSKEGILSMLFELANEGYIEISDVSKGEYGFTKLKEYQGDKYKKMFFNALFDGKDYTDTTILSADDDFYDAVQRIEKSYTAANKEIDVVSDRSRISRSISKGISGTVTTMAIIIAYIGLRAGSFMVIGLAALFGLLCSLVSRQSKKMGSYTDEFRPVAGQIKGFKKFIEYAEKPKLEELIEKYPTYFYDVLPYAYALDVTDKYAKNFEGIMMPPPSYYTGTSFHPVYFTSSISHSMSSACTSHSSGGSGFSGGGSFSGGGGGGGGGGGSW